MRGAIRYMLLATAVLLLAAGTAQASGFSIYEAGARATALGGAFTATADDGSALFYNPAGISFIEGRSIQGDFMPITPEFNFAAATTQSDNIGMSSPATAKTVSQTFPIPGLYYTSNHGTISWGIGAYAPFGLGVKWADPETYIGRTTSYDVTIETVYGTPAISWRFAENFAISGGVDIARQTIDLNRFTQHPTTGENALDTNISGHSSINVTPCFGFMGHLSKFTLGAMYHWQKTMKYDDGEAKLENVASGDSYAWAAALLQGIGGTTHKITSELNLPSIMSLAVAYSFTEKIKLEFNAVHFGWSTFQSLNIKSDTSALNQEIHFNYEDSWQYRFGLDMGLSDHFQGMLGYVYDKTPQPLASVSPILADSNRNDYSLGLMWHNDHWRVTGAYMAVIADQRTNIENGEAVRNSTSYPVGTYSTVANIFAIGLGYRF